MSTPDTELILNRIVDAEDAPGEWSAFLVETESRPELWRELALSQRDARLLMVGVCERIEASGSLTSARGSTAARLDSNPSTSRRHGWGAARTGWAIAACIGGAWILSASIQFDRQRTPPSGAPGSGNVTRASLLSPDEAFRAYLEAGEKDGSVLGEVPGKQVLERRPAGNGEGFEVLIIRQVIERRHVPAMLEFNQGDELGRPIPNVMTPPRLRQAS